MHETCDESKYMTAEVRVRFVSSQCTSPHSATTAAMEWRPAMATCASLAPEARLQSARTAPVVRLHIFFGHFFNAVLLGM
jgi:hypothetical protein